jgi:hypothetical protein
MQDEFEKCEFEIILPHNVREDVIAIGYTIGKIIGTLPRPANPWKILVDGTRDGGKSLIALSVDQFLNPASYPSGLHTGIGANDCVFKQSPDKQHKVHFFDVHNVYHRLEYWEKHSNPESAPISQPLAVVFQNTKYSVIDDCRPGWNFKIDFWECYNRILDNYDERKVKVEFAELSLQQSFMHWHGS